MSKSGDFTKREKDPIVYAVKAGKAPERVPDSIPGAILLAMWLRETGHRAAWVMLDEGVENNPPKPSCYGSAGE